MTLPASGPLTRTQIRTEFSLGAGAVWPTDYFGLGGAPSSRPLKYSDFHGLSSDHAPDFTVAPGEHFYGDPGDVIIQDTYGHNLVWTWSQTGSHAVGSTVPSGSADGGTGIHFSFGVNSTFDVWTADVTLSTVYLGVTYNWTLHLSNTGLN